MRKVAIVGFGELGKQFYNFIKQQKGVDFIFFDDLTSQSRSSNSFAFNDYLKNQFQSCDFFIALGYHHLLLKENIINQLISNKSKVPKYLHSSSFVNKSATIEDGSFIYPMCNIDKDVLIGKGVLINNSVCISHNTIVEDSCYISPGVLISGNAIIGKRTFIGSGAIISNDVKIGKDVKIGIGSVITKDIPDGYSVIGNPAKLLNKDLKII